MIETTSTIDDLSRLRAIPLKMAQAIAPLYDNADLDRYARFLNSMYHYTIRSEDQLRSAASMTDDPALRSLFLEMADEERGHYKLAEMDLNATGRDVDLNMPPAVQAMHDFWESVDRDHVPVLLGALYSFENVAGHAGGVAMDALTAMGLDKTRTRFVGVHVIADEHHGKMVDDLCKRYIAQHAEDILSGAQQAADHWVAMHLAVI
jgi:hypothetical protein